LDEKPGFVSEKLFGRYQALVLLLFAFFLTTICGGILGYYFQNRSWDKQHRDSVLESEKASAERVFSEISRLMDTRMYKMRRLFWGYKSHLEKNEIDIRWAEYQDILDEWNSNLNKNLALIQIYFGNSARSIFEGRIHSQFRYWGGELEEMRKVSSIQKDDLGMIERGLDELNDIFYFYDLQLLYAIRDQNIGQFLKSEIQLE
jgi:hypothetical protein